jgi:hypothetical protein
MSMGAEFFTLALSIEGEEGYDERIYEQFMPRLIDKLTYDISPDGVLYENVKGFIPLHPIVAAGRRGERKHLKHNHLYNMITSKFYNTMNVHNRYIPRGRNRQGWRLPELGKGLEEQRYWVPGVGTGPGGDASFSWSWMIKRLYPDDPVVDMIYKTACEMQNFDLFTGDPKKETRYDGKIHYNVRSQLDLQLLCATEHHKDEKGELINYQNGPTAELKKKKKSWVDLRRGISAMRSGWDKDDMFVHYECRSDMFYGGHETPEQGDLTLGSDGMVWSPYTGAYMDSYYRNMVLIDGKAGVYQPIAGKFMSLTDSGEACTIVSDATDAYNWRKREKNFYLWHDMLDTAPHHTNWLKFMGFRKNRNWELPFQSQMREFYDGFAHLDWGPWHGETRGPEYFERWNNVDHVFRTMHMARGDKPYLLVVDDLKKDDQKHQFDWNFVVAGDVELLSAKSVVKNRHLTDDTEGGIGTDIILCAADTRRKRNSFGIFGGNMPDVKREPKLGEPLLLVRVLWRNTEFPYPLPSFEEAHQYGRVKVPAYAVDPEFRVLIYPYRHGEDLPITSWSEDRSELRVKIGKDSDVYNFEKTERDRTVFSMERNGKFIMNSDAQPRSPVFSNVLPKDHQRIDHGPNKVEHDGQYLLAFDAPPVGALIRYTLDGSEPNESSSLYTAPVSLSGDLVVKAKTFQTGWKSGPSKSSKTQSLKLIQKKMSLASKLPSGTKQGVRLELYEKFNSIFNEKGFFTGDKNMLPKLEKDDRIVDLHLSSLSVPDVRTNSQKKDMKKGYYVYSGYYYSQGGKEDFKLNSCGPISFEIGSQVIIHEPGPYYTSTRIRYGSAVLQKGWHAFHLTICDPVFWKGKMESKMSFTLQSKCKESPYQEISVDRFQSQGGASLEVVDRSTTGQDPVSQQGWISGITLRHHDLLKHIPQGSLLDFAHGRSSYVIPTNGLPEGMLDVLNQATPYAQKQVNTFDGNDTLPRVLEYTGCFIASHDGLYRFELDGEGVNELVISGKVMARNRIQGAAAHSGIHLKAGAHPYSLRIVKGKARFRVKTPMDHDLRLATQGEFLSQKNNKVFSDDRHIASLTANKIGEDGQLEITGANVKARIYGGKVIDSPNGKAYQLLENSSRIEVLGLSMPEDAFSISMLIKRGSQFKQIEPVYCPNKIQSRFRNKDIIWANFYRNYTDRVQCNGISTMKEGKWFRLTMTYGSHVSVYVDGVLVGQQQTQEANRYNASVDARPPFLQLMKGDVGGAIAEVIIYNKVLGAEEIQAFTPAKN